MCSIVKLFRWLRREPKPEIMTPPTRTTFADPHVMHIVRRQHAVNDVDYTAALIAEHTRGDQ